MDSPHVSSPPSWHERHTAESEVSWLRAQQQAREAEDLRARLAPPPLPPKLEIEQTACDSCGTRVIVGWELCRGVLERRRLRQCNCEESQRNDATATRRLQTPTKDMDFNRHGHASTTPATKSSGSSRIGSGNCSSVYANVVGHLYGSPLVVDSPVAAATAASLSPPSWHDRAMAAALKQVQERDVALNAASAAARRQRQGGVMTPTTATRTAQSTPQPPARQNTSTGSSNGGGNLNGFSPSLNLSPLAPLLKRITLPRRPPHRHGGLVGWCKQRWHRVSRTCSTPLSTSAAAATTAPAYLYPASAWPAQSSVVMLVCLGTAAVMLSVAIFASIAAVAAAVFVMVAVGVASQATAEVIARGSHADPAATTAAPTEPKATTAAAPATMTSTLTFGTTSTTTATETLSTSPSHQKAPSTSALRTSMPTTEKMCADDDSSTPSSAFSPLNYRDHNQHNQQQRPTPPTAVTETTEGRNAYFGNGGENGGGGGGYARASVVWSGGGGEDNTGDYDNHHPSTASSSSSSPLASTSSRRGVSAPAAAAAAASPFFEESRWSAGGAVTLSEQRVLSSLSSTSSSTSPSSSSSSLLLSASAASSSSSSSGMLAMVMTPASASNFNSMSISFAASVGNTTTNNNNNNSGFAMATQAVEEGEEEEREGDEQDMDGSGDAAAAASRSRSGSSSNDDESGMVSTATTGILRGTRDSSGGNKLTQKQQQQQQQYTSRKKLQFDATTPSPAQHPRRFQGGGSALPLRPSKAASAGGAAASVAAFSHSRLVIKQQQQQRGNSDPSGNMSTTGNSNSGSGAGLLGRSSSSFEEQQQPQQQQQDRPSVVSSPVPSEADTLSALSLLQRSLRSDAALARSVAELSRQEEGEEGEEKKHGEENNDQKGRVNEVKGGGGDGVGEEEQRWGDLLAAAAKVAEEQMSPQRIQQQERSKALLARQRQREVALLLEMKELGDKAAAEEAAAAAQRHALEVEKARKQEKEDREKAAAAAAASAAAAANAAAVQLKLKQEEDEQNTQQQERLLEEAAAATATTAGVAGQVQTSGSPAAPAVQQQQPSPPAQVEVEDCPLVSAWRVLAARAESKKRSWLSKVSKLKVHFGTLNHNPKDILASAQGICEGGVAAGFSADGGDGGGGQVGPSPTSELFDYFLVSTVLSQVGALKGEAAADEFVKYAGFLVRCMELRPSLGKVAIGGVAAAMAAAAPLPQGGGGSGSGGSGGLLLSPLAPGVPTAQLPPRDEQAYLELTSLWCCLISPMRELVSASLRLSAGLAPQAADWRVASAHGGGGGGDGVGDALVWLSRLGNTAAQKIQKRGDALTQAQAVNLVHRCLEPALRVMGPTLWRCYGHRFEAVLAHIRKEVLRPLDQTHLGFHCTERTQSNQPWASQRVDSFLAVLGLDAADNSNCTKPGAPLRHNGGSYPPSQRVPGPFLEYAEEYERGEKPRAKRAWLEQAARQLLELRAPHLGPKPRPS